jgi:hypothetical protein
MLKACQYVINETKVGVGMKKFFLFKIRKLLPKRQSLGLKNPRKANMNRKRLAMKLACGTRNQRPS